MGSLAIERSPILRVQTPFQRLQSNRSPVESPPIAKKLLRSSAPLMEGSAVTVAGKENRSILKRPTGGDARSSSWYAGQTSSPPRKVNFQQDVAVVVYDRVDGDYVCSQSQQLNTEPKDRRQFVSRTLARCQPCRTLTTPGADFQRSLSKPSLSGTVAAGPGRPLPSSSIGAKPCGVESGIGFTFHEDSAGQLWLRFTVVLGPGVAAGDALVKANVTGNKVRVLGTRSTESGAGKEEFTMRYALPMDVDPYAISARMDTSGNLFVEAPVMTSNSCRSAGK